MIITDFLYIKLNQLKKDLGLDELIIKCYDEQEFMSVKPDENEISIITKKMMSSLTFNTTTTPYQILVMSEQNSLEQTQALLNKFSTDNNWSVITEGTTYTKLQLSQPMVMNNFEIVGVGYRSVLFISATTYELKNVIDMRNVKINNEEINIIGASIGYGANLNTEQFPSGELATSVKESGALSLSLVVPCTNTTLNQDALKIMFDKRKVDDPSISEVSGNKDFVFSFDIGNINVSNLPMKISEVSFATAINDIPSINIVFVR